MDGATMIKDASDVLRAGGRPSIHDARPMTPAMDSAAPRQDRASRQLVGLTFNELVSLDIPERRCLLDPWLRERDTAMVHAYRGVGKSWFAHAVAVAVASGSRFLCWSAAEPRRVVLVDGELPTRTLQDRLRMTVRALEADLDGDRAENLHIIAADYQEHGIPSLATTEGQASIEPHLDGVALVILDNVATLAPGLEENAAEGWQPVQSWMLSLRRRGIAVLLVHHEGKGGKQRGTSAREDILDVVISLKHGSDYNPTAGLDAELRFEKARGLTGADVESLAVSLTTDDTGGLRWTFKRLEDTKRAKVLELAAEGLTVRVIAEATGVPKSTVHRWTKAGGIGPDAVKRQRRLRGLE
jgi:putative DNA primase/helicase